MDEENSNPKPVKTEHWDRITAILSMFVALCALVTSVWQGQLTMIHNRLSVTPILETHIRIVDQPMRYEVILENNGLGPGRVLHCSYTLDNETYADLDTLVAKLGLAHLGVHMDLADPVRVFKPGDSVSMITLTADGKPDFDIGKVAALMKKVRVEVDYESLYHEKHIEESAF